MADSQVHNVDFYYTKEELGSLIATLMDESQMEKHRYKLTDDDNAVLVYPVPPSLPMGRFYWKEVPIDGKCTLSLEIVRGCCQTDMLRELAILELRAFGVIKHGKVAIERR